MDLWTDMRLRPYMAVTGHWIEAKVIQTPEGPQYFLQLRSALLGFIRVPGHHDGEHLAEAFLHVIDRVGAAKKVRIALHFNFDFAEPPRNLAAWLGHPR